MARAVSLELGDTKNDAMTRDACHLIFLFRIEPRRTFQFTWSKSGDNQPIHF